MPLIAQASTYQADEVHLINKRLLDLPNEMLAEILSYVLKAPALIVNAGVPQVLLWTRFYDFDDPSFGDIDTRVLASCRCLNRIGTLILYEQSTFLYKMRSSYGEGDTPRPTICRPPMKARHLVMRLKPADYDSSITTITDEANLWLRGFRDMQTLHMDFCFVKDPSNMPLKYDFCNEKQQKRHLEQAERLLDEPLVDLPGKLPRLQKLVFSGLPCNPVSVGLINGWARFVIPEGIIGVGFGLEGCKWYTENDGTRPDRTRLRESSGSNIVYRQKRDLERWILCDYDAYIIQITNTA
ncbi:MAG: hypothetical protein Q9226_004026 [Calogaya cf. arnoldii]